MTSKSNIKIAEICTLKTGGTPSRSHPEYFGGGIKWLVSGDIHKGEIFDCEGRITEEAVKNSNAKLLPANSVMIALNGQGKTRGSVAILRTEAACNQSLVAMIPNESILPEFLYYNLTSRYPEIRNLTGTDDRSGLNMDIVRNIEVPSPPLEIQSRIVNRVDTITKTRNLNKTLIEKADELFHALLHKELHAAYKDSEIVEFGNIINPQYGYTASAQETGSYRIVRITDINSDGELVQEDKKYVELSKEDASPYLVEKGDLLLARTGATFGKVLHFQDSEPAVFASFLIRLNPNIKIVDPQFIWLFTRSDFYWHQARRLMVGGGQPQFNGNQLKKIKIPLPSIAVQRRIISNVFPALQYKRSLIAEESKLGELFYSVLSRSFTGELVEAKAEAKVNKFALQQAIAAVLRQFERGEMVLAKVLYIAQEIYQVPLGFRFAAHNFGPYDAEIKRALMAGMSTYNRFFTRKGTGAYALGANAEKLFKYRSKVLGNMTAVLNDLLPYIKNADSSSIECLATVCKIMQDNKTTDVELIKQKMYEWKKDRFSAAQIKGAYEFAISKEWDKKLTV